MFTKIFTIYVYALDPLTPGGVRYEISSHSEFPSMANHNINSNSWRRNFQAIHWVRGSGDSFRSYQIDVVVSCILSVLITAFGYVAINIDDRTPKFGDINGELSVKSGYATARWSPFIAQKYHINAIRFWFLLLFIAHVWCLQRVLSYFSVRNVQQISCEACTEVNQIQSSLFFDMTPKQSKAHVLCPYLDKHRTIFGRTS